jgi:hypothetical protein
MMELDESEYTPALMLQNRLSWTKPVVIPDLLITASSD